MTIAELCVKRPVFAVMLISFLVVLGIFSFRDLGVDLFPKADPLVVSVSVKLPGATPEEVITQVVLPLEESLSSISGLDEMQSTALEGGARLTCQFVLERDIESAAQDVREKVATAIRKLPTNLELPPHHEGGPRCRPCAFDGGGWQRDFARDNGNRRQDRQGDAGNGKRKVSLCRRPSFRRTMCVCGLF